MHNHHPPPNQPSLPPSTNRNTTPYNALNPHYTLPSPSLDPIIPSHHLQEQRSNRTSTGKHTNLDSASCARELRGSGLGAAGLVASADGGLGGRLWGLGVAGASRDARVGDGGGGIGGHGGDVGAGGGGGVLESSVGGWLGNVEVEKGGGRVVLGHGDGDDRLAGLLSSVLGGSDGDERSGDGEEAHGESVGVEVVWVLKVGGR